MRFESNAESQVAKLPAFLTYCKSNKLGNTERRYIVNTVWLPNRYQNISLDTEYFRLRISSGQDLFLELLDWIESNTESEALLCVDILDAKKGRFAIEVVEGEKAEWEPLGDHGWRITVADRPKSTRKRNLQNS